LTDGTGRRGEAAQRYDLLLAGEERIVTPSRREKARHVFHQYTVRVRGGRRDEVRAMLAERGIATMVYYPVPLHRLPVYREGGASLPLAERAAQEVLSLPIWPGIPAKVQERVADALRAAL